jgi:phosphatidylinositol kinase/protein kinase (PI-3  family)
VRTAAVSVLSRAAHYNAVHIMPVVLLSLRVLLNLLQTSREGHTLRGAVRMLQALVKGLGSYIVPYVKQVLKPLLDLLSNPSYEIVGEALSTIGEVAIASPDMIHEHLDRLFPSLIQALRDSSSITKQETAVIALGKLVTSLHMVNEPYTKYPGLFEGLVSAIQNSQEEASELRKQAIKTAGLLGALEAGLFEKYMRNKSGAGNVFAQDNLEDDTDEELLSKKSQAPYDEESLSKLDRYYLSVVLKALLAILKDPAQTLHHQTAINICTRIIRNLGRRSHYQTDDVIDGIFERIHSATGGSSLQSSLIDLLIALIYSVGAHLSRHYSKIVRFIITYFPQYQLSCLSVLEALHLSVPTQDFGFIIPEIIAVMVSTIKQEPLGTFEDVVISTISPHNSGRFDSEENRKSLPRTGLIMKTLTKIANALHEYNLVLIPVLLGDFQDF